MTDRADVHVGDVGTEYRVRLTDAGVAFDPTEATTTEILFRFASGLIVRVAATVEAGEGEWWLVHQVTDPSFHARAGRFSMQARLVFPDGSVYHSSIQTADEAGAALAIAKNLS
jgi:hypothetical protein